MVKMYRALPYSTGPLKRRSPGKSEPKKILAGASRLSENGHNYLPLLISGTYPQPDESFITYLCSA